MPKQTLGTPTRYGLLAAACLVLVFQASATRLLRIDEQNIPIPGLHRLPFELDQWKASSEQTMAATTEAYLKPDEYIMRDYGKAADGSNINLFVAYFKSLQSKYGPHSPSICLPASGWLVSSSKIVEITVPGRSEAIPVNQYTMEKSGERLLVLYWYQNDRDTWAQEVHAKIRLLPDLLRYHRSDVSLVRLISPLRGMTPEKELADCYRFTQDLFPLLAERFGSVH